MTMMASCCCCRDDDSKQDVQSTVPSMVSSEPPTPHRMLRHDDKVIALGAVASRGIQSLRCQNKGETGSDGLQGEQSPQRTPVRYQYMGSEVECCRSEEMQGSGELMATVESVEIDDLSTHIALQKLRLFSNLGDEPSSLLKSVSPRSVGDASRRSIESDREDELDVIIRGVQERTRSESPSRSPTKSGASERSPKVAAMVTPSSTTSRSSRKQRKSGLKPPPSSKSTRRESRTLPTSTNISRSSQPERRSEAPSGQDLVKKSSLQCLRSSANILQAVEDRELSSQKIEDDALSDLPSDVEPFVRERYLKACGLLKSALIRKDKALLPDEKSFLQSLIDENEDTPSEAAVTALETSFETLLSDPLFDVASFGSSAFEISYRGGRTRVIPSPVSHKEDDQTVASFASFNGKDYPFRILGADMDKPSVLTPALMEALRGFLPDVVRRENFWLKFCKGRDGPSLASLLTKVRTSKYTLLGVETKDGHVFGCFCSTPWRVQRSWFGSTDCFLWRLKSSRVMPGRKTRSFANDNKMEVFPYGGHDNLIQYCTKQTLAVGGGVWEQSETSPYPKEPMGTGFTIDGDLMGGETNACATFANPRLGDQSCGSSEFDIVGLEVWTLTPCDNVKDAEQLQMRRLFTQDSASI